MLTGLALRPLWVLDTDKRLLSEAITVLFDHSVELFELSSF
jgi:hypothetical protein